MCFGEQCGANEENRAVGPPTAQPLSTHTGAEQFVYKPLAACTMQVFNPAGDQTVQFLLSI